MANIFIEFHFPLLIEKPHDRSDIRIQQAGNATLFRHCIAGRITITVNARYEILFTH
jgi:hypothetical protein